MTLVLYAPKPYSSDLGSYIGGVLHLSPLSFSHRVPVDILHFRE